jgi:hypothetical protein
MHLLGEVRIGPGRYCKGPPKSSALSSYKTSGAYPGYSIGQAHSLVRNL